MKKHIPQNYFMVSKFTKTIFRAIETPQMHMSNFQIKIANYKTRMNLHSQQHMNTSSKTQIKSDYKLPRASGTNANNHKFM